MVRKMIKCLKKKVLFLTAFWLVLVSLYFPVNPSLSQEWERTDIETEDYYIGGGNPAFNSIHMASGKYVYASGRHSMTNNLDVYVYNVDGEELAHSTITLAIWSSTAVDRWITDISLYDNGTTLIMFVGGYAKDVSNNYAFAPSIYIFDMTAYTAASAGGGVAYGGGVSYNPKIEMSRPYLYEDVLYCLMTVDSSTDYTKTMKLNLTDSSAAFDYPTGYQYAIPFSGTIFGFQNTTGLEMVYTIAGKAGDTSRPTYWKWNMTADTVTLLADNPTDDHWRVSEPYISLRYIGGGIYYKGDGDAILYQTWGWCDDYGNLEIMQHRLEFNAGSIASGDLEDQNSRNVIFGQSNYLAEAEVSFGGGYLVSKSEMNIFRVVQTAAYSGVFYTMRSEISVYDFEDFTDTGLDVDFQIEDESVISEGIYNRIYKIFTSSMQTTEKSDNLYIYLYSGLAESSWSISWSISPDDNPLLTNKNYTYYCEVRKEGALQDAEIFIKFDGVNFAVKESSGGEFSFWSIVSESGYHTWSFLIYQSGDWKATFTKTKFYEQFGNPEEEDGEEGGWIPSFPTTVDLSAFGNIVPIIVVIGFFAWAGHLLMGMWGLMGGFVGGLFVMANFGDMPMYILYFVILIAILTLVYKLRQPSISMNGGSGA